MPLLNAPTITAGQQPSRSISPVEFIRVEVEQMLERWKVIRAALDGESAVKALSTQILPMPNSEDSSAENNARYNAYLNRAVWYNVSARTLSGLTGYVFAKEPVVELPDTLKGLEQNVDGAGVHLIAQAKACLRLVLGFGRAGLLVDYPTVKQATTRQQLLDGNVQPTLCLYQPETIRNWKTSMIGSRMVLDLLVLMETYTVSEGENEFELEQRTQYRVLRRTADGVTGEIQRQKDDGSEFAPVSDLAYKPTDQSGKPLLEIPFTFIGAVNNDPDVDAPPIEDLVNLNLAHFRNSADYEEASFLVGQPTPWVSGLTEQWVDKVLGGKVMLGSRSVLPLPVGGAAGLLQVAANTMPHEAMEAKERQMVALGAKLVQQADVQRTATEAGLEHTSEVSTLVSASTNVFQAYKWALQIAGSFVGTAETTIEFDLSEPLSSEVISPEQATSLLTLWQGGLIDFEEARHTLRKSGVAYKEDDEVKASIADEGLPADPNKPPPTEQPPR